MRASERKIANDGFGRGCPLRAYCYRTAHRAGYNPDVITIIFGIAMQCRMGGLCNKFSMRVRAGRSLGTEVGKKAKMCPDIPARLRPVAAIVSFSRHRLGDATFTWIKLMYLKLFIRYFVLHMRISKITMGITDLHGSTT